MFLPTQRDWEEKQHYNKGSQKSARLLHVQENSENRQQAQGHPCGGIIYIFFNHHKAQHQSAVPQF